MNYFLALIPALCFGIVPSIIAKVGGRPTQQQLMTAISVIVFAVAVQLLFRPVLSGPVALGSVTSGLFWALGSVLQYASYSLMGSARAFCLQTGIQLALNALVGVMVFGEWSDPASLLMGCVAIAIIVAGAALTASATGGQAASERGTGKGLLLSILASVCFVAYSTVPRFVNADGVSAVFPQACGVVIGAVAIGVIDWIHCRSVDRTAPFLSPRLWPCLFSGLIFAVGNIALILSNQVNGIAVGFTFSQLAVIVSSVMGVFVLHEVRGRKAILVTGLGVAMVVIGAVLIGLTKA